MFKNFQLLIITLIWCLFSSDIAVARDNHAMTLAVSWQAAFCEGHERKRECRSQREDRFDATHFSLHGLWFEKSNCAGPDYNRLPQPLWEKSRKVMPGTMSGLHKHEWRKHGRCYGKDVETYYEVSLKLMDELNQTVIRDMFAKSAGQFLSTREIRATFNQVFGRGVGDRVRVKCVKDGERVSIQELRLRLRGDPEKDGLRTLLRQARGQKQGCTGGIIDRVGLQ